MARAINQPAFAVIIPARNIEDFIGPTIKSVTDQTFQDFELIVVVDSSTDATVTIAQNTGDPRVKVDEVTLGGVSAARNHGLERTSARYVIFLDGDDLLTPDALSLFHETFRNHPNAVAVIGGHDKITEDGQSIPGEEASARPPVPVPDPLPSLLRRNLIVNGGALAIRAETAREVGGFDPELRIGEDWEFWCRLAGAGPFASLGQTTALLYRQRGASAMGGVSAETGLAKEAIAKIYQSPAVLRRFSARDLERMRRTALINNFWSAARATLYRSEYRRFAGFLAIGALRYPESLFQGFLIRFVTRKLFSRRSGPEAGTGAHARGA
ncbi:MAG: glycosyltransferase family A protein [Geminicoccaceae bacterium]